MTDPKKAPRGLGRGLDALLSPTPAPRARELREDYGVDNVFLCPVDKIQPQRQQPRQAFDHERLQELADSIRQHGLLEPLVVRRAAQGDGFELIAGERRWRASQRAGLKDVLVVVRDVSQKEAFELALIENIQREDLNPIEFAEAMDRLLREHGYTQDSLAARVGKDRSTITNALRLLKLPAEVRTRVVNGELSEGHARALLGAPDAATLATLADKVLRGRLSVRQTEALVRAAKNVEAQAPRGHAPSKTVAVRDLEARLQKKLGTKVDVRDRAGQGELRITYSSLDELDRILELLL